MFGRNRRREDYELIEVDENTPSSSLRGFSSRLSGGQFSEEREPLVHSNKEVKSQAGVYDAPLDHSLNNDGTSVQQPQTADNRWEHIGNPDQFLTRFYQYHQGGGFVCVVTGRVCYLLQYIFVVSFATFLLECVDYSVMFNNKNTTADGVPITGKRHVQDIIIGNCTSHFNPLVTGSLFFATTVWIFLCIRAGYHLVQFYEIRTFYRKALGIEDENLGNLTWCEVLALLCQKLPDLHVIIAKDKLNELDVCQRILRFKNYFVALVNKDLLPPVLNLPFLGPHPYLSNGLKLNLDFLFFWGPLSPWEGPYTLKDEYKDPQNAGKLTAEMRKSVSLLGLINLLFIPLIFAYQLLYIFFSYVELIKRDPSAFGKRRYSNYGRSKLRHFNELDHQLQIRLARSHEVATRYMNLFTSPFMEIIAKNIKFVAGSIFAVLFVLAAWDEDVLTLEHALTIMTVTFVIVIVCNSMITSEDCVYIPERLMKSIIACIQYAPISWEGKAHTQAVRKEFDHLYPLTARYIIEELFSPLITPFILLFWVRPRAQQFVEFFIRFTVSIEGLGDVCSFAQMDIAKHGDEKWSSSFGSFAGDDDIMIDRDEDDKANDGKTEISLLNFATMNPWWEPPPLSIGFISDLKTRAQKDLADYDERQSCDHLFGDINSVVNHSTFMSFDTRNSLLRPRLAQLPSEMSSRFDHMGPLSSEANLASSSTEQKSVLQPKTLMVINGVPSAVNSLSAAEEIAMSTLYLRQHVSDSDSLRITSGDAGEENGRSRFVNNSRIWGVPVLDDTVTDSSIPVLFGNRS